MRREPGPPRHGRLAALPLAIGLISGAALAYQLLLMRSFSIAQWHHFAHMVISLALLGYGASGALLTVLRAPLLARFEAAVAVAAALFALLAPAAVAAVQRIRLNPLELMWDPRQAAAFAAVYLILAIPFVCAGGTVALALARFPEAQHRIYRADLVGAAAGAVAVVGALFAFPLEICLRLVGVAGGVAASILAAGRGRSGRAASILGLLAIAGAAAWPAAWLAPVPSEYKALSKALAVPGAEVIAERSSPFGALAAVRSPRIPFRIAPGASFAFTGEIPEQVVVFSDGEVAGVVDRSAGPGDSGAYLDFLPEALPFHLRGDGSLTALLGVGPGATLALARRHGAAVIDFVDADPRMAELVAEELASFGGDLLADPRVRTHVVDPRGFLTAHGGPFDLVFLPPAEPGSAPGAKALRESYAHTVEAFALAVDRLSDRGILAVAGELSAPPRSAVKLLATAIEALERSGGDASGRLAAIRSWNRFLVMVRSSPFTPTEIEAIRAFCAERSFDLVYHPGMSESAANRYHLLDEPVLHRTALALLGPGRRQLLANYKFYVEPAIDDRPYFYRSFRWVSLTELLRLRSRGGAALVEWSYLLLLATLAQAVIAGLALILLPLWFVARRSARRSGGVGLYFLCLGLAFLFLEIAFIQRLTLFLGHPILAVAVVLAGFLLFAGIGSGVSRRLEGRWPRSPVRLAVGAIIVSVIGAAALSELLVAACAGWPAWVKVPLALLAIAPLAFFLGMPFPLGLRRLSASRPDLVPWAWGVNGWASVLSAVLATLLAVHAGFTAVVIAACGLYLVAACSPIALGEAARPAAGPRS